MFNPSREEVRRFFTGAWDKERSAALLSPLETIAVEWIVEHPEFHSLLESEDAALAAQYRPDDGRTNPFLHLSMHLTITEQVAIDQPPGIRAATLELARRLGSLHEAQHAVMECLGEMLWSAQRAGLPPDGEAYVECVRRQLA
jgi:hypothetical protein